MVSFTVSSDVYPSGQERCSDSSSLQYLASVVKYWKPDTVSLSFVYQVNKHQYLNFVIQTTLDCNTGSFALRPFIEGPKHLDSIYICYEFFILWVPVYPLAIKTLFETVRMLVRQRFNKASLYNGQCRSQVQWSSRMLSWVVSYIWSSIRCPVFMVKMAVIRIEWPERDNVT